MIENDFDTATGEPANGGTWALRKAAATQPPTGVPANGGPSTDADVTLPLGAKVTLTRAVPVGPSGFAHPRAAPDAPPSAAIAAARSNSPPPLAGASAFFSFLRGRRCLGDGRLFVLLLVVLRVLLLVVALSGRAADGRARALSFAACGSADARRRPVSAGAALAASAAGAADALAAGAADAGVVAAAVGCGAPRPSARSPSFAASVDGAGGRVEHERRHAAEAFTTTIASAMKMPALLFSLRLLRRVRHRRRRVRRVRLRTAIGGGESGASTTGAISDGGASTGADHAAAEVHDVVEPGAAAVVLRRGGGRAHVALHLGARGRLRAGERRDREQHRVLVALADEPIAGRARRRRHLRRGRLLRAEEVHGASAPGLLRRRRARARPRLRRERAHHGLIHRDRAAEADDRRSRRQRRRASAAPWRAGASSGTLVMGIQSPMPSFHTYVSVVSVPRWNS